MLSTDLITINNPGYTDKIVEFVHGERQKYLEISMYCSIFCLYKCICIVNRICGVMISMLASSTVGRGFDSRTGQTKDYAIGICYFSTKHAALRRKSKDCLVRNQDNLSEWGDMSIR